MYRRCISCSADLGANEALEEFPVGRSVAFDAARGRLWAVCPGCARWNLAPIEQRWEPVEAAETLFRDARLRVQSENVGLARLPDGTRLVRIGDALSGELAAWRYGAQLVKRRRRYLVAGGVVAAGTMAMFGGLAALGVGSGLAFAAQGLTYQWEEHRQKKVVHRIAAGASPTGREIAVRRWHVQGGWLGPAETGGGVALHLPDVERKSPKKDVWERHRFSDDVVVLRGADAGAVLRRGMVQVNEKGASAGDVRDAVRLLEEAGSAEGYLLGAARRGNVLGRRRDMRERALTRPGALALEMALHEEQERRALEGELAALEAAWRQAEEIASIADALPDDPLEALKRRLAGLTGGG